MGETNRNNRLQIVIILALTLLIVSLYPLTIPFPSSALDFASEATYQQQLAQKLQEAGLFKGTGTSFELDRPATRAEIAVMLVRMLGQEQAALADYANRGKKAANRFPDVPDWADPYVDYLTANQLVYGLPDGTYGSARSAAAKDYATLMLRALGYHSTSDFTWGDSLTFAAGKGIIETGSLPAVQSSPFLRGDCVQMAFLSLHATVKNAETPLLDKLIALGAVKGTARELLVLPERPVGDGTSATGPGSAGSASLAGVETLYYPTFVAESDRYVAYINNQEYLGGLTLVDKKNQVTSKLVGIDAYQLVLTPKYLVYETVEGSSSTGNLLHVVSLETLEQVRQFTVPGNQYAVAGESLLYADAQDVFRMKALVEMGATAASAAPDPVAVLSKTATKTLLLLDNASELHALTSQDVRIASSVMQYELLPDGQLLYLTKLDASMKNRLVKRNLATGAENVLMEGVLRFAVHGSRLYVQAVTGTEERTPSGELLLEGAPVQVMALDGTGRKQVLAGTYLLEGAIAQGVCFSSLEAVTASRTQRVTKWSADPAVSQKPLSALTVGTVTTKDWSDPARTTTHRLADSPRLTHPDWMVRRTGGTAAGEAYSWYRINYFEMMKRYPAGSTAYLVELTDAFRQDNAPDGIVLDSLVNGISLTETLEVHRAGSGITTTFVENQAGVSHVLAVFGPNRALLGVQVVSDLPSTYAYVDEKTFVVLLDRDVTGEDLTALSLRLFHGREPLVRTKLVYADGSSVPITVGSVGGPSTIEGFDAMTPEMQAALLKEHPRNALKVSCYVSPNAKLEFAYGPEAGVLEIR